MGLLLWLSNKNIGLLLWLSNKNKGLILWLIVIKKCTLTFPSSARLVLSRKFESRLLLFVAAPVLLSSRRRGRPARGWIRWLALSVHISYRSSSSLFLYLSAGVCSWRMPGWCLPPWLASGELLWRRSQAVFFSALWFLGGFPAELESTKATSV